MDEVFVDSIDKLKEFFEQFDYRCGFNLFVDDMGTRNKRYYQKIHYVGSYAYSVIFPYEFYNEKKDEIDYLVSEYGKIRNKKVLEKIENYNGGETTEELRVYIDKTNFDIDFIRDVINSEVKRPLILYFIDVKPPEELYFLFRKNKVDVIYSKNNFSESFQNTYNWISKYEICSWDEEGSFFTINCDMLNNCPDIIKYLPKIDSITFSNWKCPFIKRTRRLFDELPFDGKDLPFYKYTCDSLFLDKVFDVVKKLRNMGYDKTIEIDCDSFLEICNSKFAYDSTGVTFDSDLSLDDVNILLDSLTMEARSALKDNENLTLSEKLNMIFVILTNALNALLAKCNDENNKEIHKDNDGSFDFNWGEISAKIFINKRVADICKMFGLKPILASFNQMYFFEENNPTPVKFDFDFLYREIVNHRGVDIENADEEITAWNTVFDSYNEGILKSYEEENMEPILIRYLLAGSVEEMVYIFKKRAGMFSDESIREIDPYLDEFYYLSGILMDLSEDDYVEFANSGYSLNSIEDITIAFTEVAKLVLENKNKIIHPSKNDNKY